MAKYTDGPDILNAVTQLLGKAISHHWDTLTHREQQTLVALAAESAQWRTGRIDPVEMNSILELNPSLSAKLNGMPTNI